MRITKQQLRSLIREIVKKDVFEDDDVEEVAPPGWEKTVKKMKDDPEIKNPWAMAWWMKSKGHKPSTR